MLKMRSSESGNSSSIKSASFTAFMQQMRLQYRISRFTHLEPTHWMNAIRPGGSPSVNLWSCPLVGPLAERSRSSSRLETTLWNRL